MTKGVVVAAVLWSLWLVAVPLGVWGVDLSTSGMLDDAALVVVITFLHTGLFITAHDAMHGSIARGHPRLNRALGAAAVACYALFSYEKLLAEHRLHHAAPGTDSDPDFHEREGGGFALWYIRFMAHYVTWRQIASMAIAFNILRYVAGARPENLIVFWVAPSLLSTLQLFYFGTYLPHRTLDGDEFADEHRARSSGFGRFVSLITCYHFGRHLEHHRRPELPWWKLADADVQERKPVSP